MDIQAPFHERQTSVFDFDTGDTPWVHAASGIKIRGIFCAEHRAVGMSCNEDTIFVFCPSGKSFFDFLLSCVIACGTGWIGKTDLFQWTPDITYKKTSCFPKGAVKKISLVSVSEINVFFMIFIPEINPRLKRNTWK